MKHVNSKLIVLSGDEHNHVIHILIIVKLGHTQITKMGPLLEKEFGNTSLFYQCTLSSANVDEIEHLYNLDGKSNFLLYSDFSINMLQ